MDSMVMTVAGIIGAAACLGGLWLAWGLLFQVGPWRGFRLSPLRLAAFRVYNMTLGRVSWGDKTLRRVLVAVLIGGKKSKDCYCQSAAFFTYDQIEGPDGAFSEAGEISRPSPKNPEP